MIILNSSKFAESEDEFTNTLFEAGSTAVGYATRYKRQIKLFNHQKVLIGVVNRWCGLCKATKLESGETWYNHGDIDEIGRYEKYGDQVSELHSLSISGDHIKGWYFK